MGGKAVILLSGGLDSCTCMAVAQAAGYELYPISFNYHQRYDREVDCAKRIAAHFHAAEHLIIETNMDAVGGSAVTDKSIDVPDGDADRTDIPVTYVPARNLIFLSYALAFAERVGAQHLYIGVN
ncbi:7-cyano-7-deazaguanine synthase, partial [Selenomonas sp. oral taxon 126]|uniref:7-cyano-7-deazaguanine synthase n=1 Tax=Selenomonas sp. oral taxon 126 TaxID=712528 RepID=UPI001560E187